MSNLANDTNAHVYGLTVCAHFCFNHAYEETNAVLPGPLKHIPQYSTEEHYLALRESLTERNHNGSTMGRGNKWGEWVGGTVSVSPGSRTVLAVNLTVPHSESLRKYFVKTLGVCAARSPGRGPARPAGFPGHS